VACQEVSNCNSVPEGMVKRTIPSNSYAVFTHRGSLESLANTWAYITKVWLPKSEYRMAGEYAFEYYDERFDNFSEKSELDIYVPVKPK
jgi:AraC family transcriptional regulator